MKPFIPVLIAVVLILVIAVTLGRSRGGGDDPAPAPATPPPAAPSAPTAQAPRYTGKGALSAQPGELNQFRYIERAGGQENTYQVFAYPQYGLVHLYEDRFDGSMRQDTVQGVEMFDQLTALINESDCLNWRYYDQKYIETVDDLEIEVEIRLGGRTYEFGTDRMPMGGIEWLRCMRDTCLGYQSDEAEVKPFEVTINGRTYHTVPGTGNSVGAGAIIDFEGEDWWEVQHYVGHYEMTDAANAVAAQASSSSSFQNAQFSNVSLDISADGKLTLNVDGDVRELKLSETRGYGVYATASGDSFFDYYQGAGLAPGADPERFLEFHMRAQPHPETFQGYSFVLERGMQQ
ncbi:MAG: hypothetical protein IJH83_08780 [Coriobacteriales bacterium]|nr:hypothetical protein [Coriobacteriales bacterium]